MDPMVRSAADTTPALGEESKDSIWPITSSSSLGWSHRENRPRYSGIYFELSASPVSRDLESSTAISFRRSGVRRDARLKRDAPATCRTTTFSLTFMRFEKCVAMCSTFWWLPRSTCSSRYSTPTAFKSQGVAVFKFSRNTLLTALCRRKNASCSAKSSPNRRHSWACKNSRGMLMPHSASDTAERTTSRWDAPSGMASSRWRRRRMAAAFCASPPFSSQ
ncbi:hypothetical protein SDC9_86457 [bioreactor metagenome]|uniref:Uncharacterized protein n=1 Tax=bioreactor metagenome TaxID=1076179 RepID=A0A644ZIY6_9ZZZZ